MSAGNPVEEHNEYYDEVLEMELPRSARAEWWALQYPDGALHGEIIAEGEGNPGFDLSLFNTQESAQAEATRLNEDTWGEEYPQLKPVEISLKIPPVE